MKRVPGPRLLTAGVLLTLGLTACGGPVQAGAAALVGDQRFDGSAFADQVQAALARPGVGEQVTNDVPAFQRAVLTQFITVQLLERVADQNGVSVDRGAIDAQLAQLEQDQGGPEALEEQAVQAGFSTPQVRDIARANALVAALQDVLPGAQISEGDLRAAYEAQQDMFDLVRVAEIQLATEAEARALLDQAQAGTDEDFAELARTRSLDTEFGAQGGDTGLQPASVFTQAGQPDVAAQAFAGEVGDVFVSNDQAGPLLVRVLERQSTTFEQARPRLEQALAGPAQQEALRTALVEAESGLDIKVNPRYGRWDAENLSVVQGNDQELSRPADGVPAESPVDGLLQPPS